MANSYEFYKEIITDITSQLDSVIYSLSGKNPNSNYTISSFGRKKNHAVCIVATNNSDGSYVRLYAHRGFIKVSCFSKENEKKCEYCRQIASDLSQTKKESMTFLFKGAGSGVKGNYLSDKVGIVERSTYDAENKCFMPEEITENYYNANQKLVNYTTFGMKQIPTSDLFQALSEYIGELSGYDALTFNFHTKTNDPIEKEKLDKATPIVQNLLTSQRLREHFNLYKLLCDNNISGQFKEIFSLLRNQMKEYIKNNNQDNGRGTVRTDYDPEFDFGDEKDR